MKKFLSIAFCMIGLAGCQSGVKNKINEEPPPSAITSEPPPDIEKEPLTETKTTCLSLAQFAQYWRSSDQMIGKINLCSYGEFAPSREALLAKQLYPLSSSQYFPSIPYAFENEKEQTVLTRSVKKHNYGTVPAVFIPKIHHETKTHIFYELLPKEEMRFRTLKHFFFEYNKLKKYNQLVTTSSARFETIYFDENILIGDGRIQGQGGDHVALYDGILKEWYFLGLGGSDGMFECSKENKTCFAVDGDRYCKIGDPENCQYHSPHLKFKRNGYKKVESDPNRTNFISFGRKERGKDQWSKIFQHKDPIVMTLEDMIKTVQMRTPVFHLGDDRYFMLITSPGEYNLEKME